MAAGPGALDVFISYAHADDDVPAVARVGWVTALVGELRKILRRKLGGNGAAIWMDHQLAAHENVSVELLDKLRRSRVLLLVMSPGYQRSPWTQRELANFLLGAGAAHDKRAVFVVEIEPIDRETWPRALRDLELTPVRFWDRGSEDGVPALLGYPVPPSDGASPYWTTLNELAHRIAACLAAKPAPRDAGRLVLVAETTDDLDEQREAVTALLRQHRFEPVPVRGYPRDTEAAYLDALRADLRQASLFVQLLGRYEGKRLPDGITFAVAIQAREALAASGERGLRLMQWRDPACDLAQVASAGHRELLSGPHVRALGFEQFRLDVLRELSAPGGPAAAAPAPTAAGGPSIFVEADAVDGDLAAAVCDSLRALDVAPVLSPPAEGPGAFARALPQRREAIRRCRGVLFVYGRAKLSWLSAAFSYVGQAMGLGGDAIWGAVLDGPPDRDGKLPFRNKHLVTLDCREGFDPAKLTAFLAALGLGGARG
jgi:hypothetical protein